MELANIGLGTVVKVWKEHRGHDYVIIGEDTINQKLLLVKNTCLNDNGSLHASTKDFHIRIPYTVIGGQRVASGITKILGLKSDIRHYSFNRIVDDKPGIRILPVLRTFKASVHFNNLNSVQY